MGGLGRVSEGLDRGQGPIQQCLTEHGQFT